MIGRRGNKHSQDMPLGLLEQGSAVNTCPWYQNDNQNTTVAEQLNISAHKFTFPLLQPEQQIPAPATKDRGFSGIAIGPILNIHLSVNRTCTKNALY
jgi:hypothetical protein